MKAGALAIADAKSLHNQFFFRQEANRLPRVAASGALREHLRSKATSATRNDPVVSWHTFSRLACVAMLQELVELAPPFYTKPNAAADGATRSCAF